MKRYLLVFFLCLSFSMSIKAQVNGKEHVYYRFCYVNFQSSLGKCKIKIEEGLGGEEDNYVTDEKGNILLFETWIAALNYLSKEGWEIAAHETINEEDDYKKNWLFKKVVSLDELQQRLNDTTSIKQKK